MEWCQEVSPEYDKYLPGTHHVRVIGPEWRNLAEGLVLVEALEVSFRAEWGTQLKEARRKMHEAELRRLFRRLLRGI